MTSMRLSRGRCLLCGESYPGNRVPGHLAACPRWETGTGRVWLIGVRSGNDTRSWLELAAGAEATLRDLHRFLLATLFACCGEGCCERRSTFRIRDGEYPSHPEPEAVGPGSMDLALEGLIEPGLEFSYDSHLDSAAALRLAVRLERKTAATVETVRLLARSEDPEITGGADTSR